jgi:hypothetical protein
MASSNILGGSVAPPQPRGTDTDALGPSDSSDSGSDVQGERPMATGPDEPDEMGAVPADLDSDTVAAGTGERESAVSERVRDAPDIRPDRILPAGDGTLGDTDADDITDLAAEPEDADSDDEAGGVESTGEPRGSGRRRNDGTPQP